MKLVIYPAVEPERLAKILAVAPDATVANMETPEAAVSEMADADAFFGKLPPEMLAAAERLRWVQSPTARLVHYVYVDQYAGSLLRRDRRSRIQLHSLFCT